MKLRKFILLIIAACAGLLSHEAFGVDSQDNSCSFEYCNTEHLFSYIHSTEITPASDSYVLASGHSITVPTLRNTNARRSTNHTNLEGKTAQTVREITRRQFSKCTGGFSLFQTICTKSADYLISIGILVI